MSVYLDIVAPPGAGMTIAPCERPARDSALESAREATRMLDEAYSLALATDKCMPTVYSRAAAIAVHRAKAAVAHMRHEYERAPSRERLTP